MSDEVEMFRTQITRLKERVTELEHRLDSQNTLKVEAGLREFVESLDPSSHTERALYIAYYLEANRGLGNFTVADIEEEYRECRVKPASNMSDVLSRMEDQGWLLRDGTDGQANLWRLTASGQEAVEKEINNDA